ncbi:WD repeat-containing protein 89 [Erythrolamprus reginae]|uniref:WD repeat-containing protein 89 n=1 Tax=Erythrolamprus reginae TaxID=121349 RepID=UPI00396CD58F
MEKIKKQFSRLQIAKRCSLTEDPSYVLDIDIPRGEGSHLVAVSCSNKSIRVYNRETLCLLQEYHSHPALLNGVRFARTNKNILFSAGSDGSLKCWDVRSSVVKPAQLFCGNPSDVFISCDISCNDLVVCAGTEKVKEDAFITFWDARGCTSSVPSSKQPLGVYSESHNDDVTKVCFHPNKPHLLASGSIDGLVNVFDINKDNEEDALLSTCNSDSSVSFIGWAGKDYWQIYCLTHDEGFCHWDLSQLDSEMSTALLHIPDVREVKNIKLDYLIGGVYHEKMDKLFVFGGRSTGSICLMERCAHKLSSVGILQGGHSATVRSFCWDMVGDSLFTGGEDAELLLWKPGAAEKALRKTSSMKMASSIYQRTKVHQDTLKTKVKK